MEEGYVIIWPWDESIWLRVNNGETDVGTYTMTPTVEGADNFDLKFVNDELKITPAPITVKTYGTEKTYDGAPIGPENTAVPISGLIGTDAYYVYGTCTGAATELVDVGETDNGYELYWNDVDSSNYEIVEDLGKLKIEPATLTVTTGSAEKVYDGEPLTDSYATITGFVNDETATVTATGSQTVVGTSVNTYKITWGSAKSGNYTIDEHLGTLEVIEEGVSLSGDSLMPADDPGGDAVEVAEDSAAEQSDKPSDEPAAEAAGDSENGTDEDPSEGPPEAALDETAEKTTDDVICDIAGDDAGASVDEPGGNTDESPGEEVAKGSPEAISGEARENAAGDDFKEIAGRATEAAADESGGKADERSVAEAVKGPSGEVSGSSEPKAYPENQSLIN